MGRPKASTRGKNIDLTEGIEWTPPPLANRGLHKHDGVGEAKLSLEDMANKPAPVLRNGKLKTGMSFRHIHENWHNLIKAAENGYEFNTMAKALGISERWFYKFLSKHPEKRAELVQARLKPRDTCVSVILNAAKSGQWLPAAWWLERTCWQEFARPEVKLQLMDRMLNQNEVVQTFNGKSLQQINAELREKYAENENFQRANQRSSSAVEQVRAELDTEGERGTGPEGGSAVVDNTPNDVLD